MRTPYRGGRARYGVGKDGQRVSRRAKQRHFCQVANLERFDPSFPFTPPALALGNHFFCYSFATNLFIGAVIEAYQALSSEDSSFLMTNAQRSWVELQKMASLVSLKAHARRPAGYVGGLRTVTAYCC